MKDLRVQKTFSLNNKNDYEKMRDIFFEKKCPGTLKLNKQKTSTYDQSGLINLLHQDDSYRLTE